MKKWLALLAIPVAAYALNTPPTSKEAAYLKNANKIVNPGAENGTAKVLVSAGTLTATTLTAEVGLGARSFKWCPAAAGNTLSMSYYVVEGALKGQNGEASMLAQTSGTDFSLRVFDGSNQLATASTLTPSSSYQSWSQNFIFPSSGSLTVNAIAGNPTNCIFLDDAYLGRPSNIGTVEQAQFVGSAYFAQTANCSWTRSNTALGAFGTDADCPAPTIDKQVIGSWQTTDADLPRITINNLPPGLYKVTATGSMYGGGKWTMAISDGTNIRGYASGGGNATGNFQPANVSTAWFEYTTAGNRTFEIYSSVSTGSVQLDNLNANDRTTFVVERYPLQSQMLLWADQGDFGWTACSMTVGAVTTPPTKATSPAVDNCQYRRVNDTLEYKWTFVANNNTGAVSGSGTYLFPLPNNLVADSTAQSISTTPTDATVVAWGSWNNGAARELPIEGFLYNSTNIAFRYLSGSAFGNPGNMVSSSNGMASSASGWKMSFEAKVKIQGWQPNQRAPALINSVISKYEGSTSFESADVTCSSSSAINNNPGSWISSIGNISSGQCAITIANGVFSGAPDCVMTPQSSTAITDAVIYRTNFISSTSGTVAAYNVTAAANATTFRVDVLCKGPK